MINIQNKEQCCGCSACVSICARGAIKMKPDALGFLYPEVNKDICNNCGLCESVCAFHPNYDKNNNLREPYVYAVRHKKMSEIETSRSGAMFVAISDWILEQGGVVYGVGYVDHFRVAHKRAVTKEECNEFKGSKYVQSDLNDTFIQVRKDLKGGLFVLYSGTPCQTSGLQSYLSALKVDMSRLYIVDIVCHGVPSPYIWRDYLSYFENRYNQKIIEVNFRDKSKLGWSSHKESFKLENTYVYADIYTHIFFQHLNFRRSCGVCHFTNLQRPSDVTLADFWGWQRVDPTFNTDDKGVSLVLVNTEKGRGLFEIIKGQINYIQTDTIKCLQPNLQKPSDVHPKIDVFEQEYVKYGFEYIGRKYSYMGLFGKLRHMAGTCKKNIIKIINR